MEIWVIVDNVPAIIHIQAFEQKHLISVTASLPGSLTVVSGEPQKNCGIVLINFSTTVSEAFTVPIDLTTSVNCLSS